MKKQKHHRMYRKWQCPPLDQLLKPAININSVKMMCIY